MIRFGAITGNRIVMEGGQAAMGTRGTQALERLVGAYGREGLDEVCEVAAKAVRVGVSVRRGPLRDDHVEALVATGGVWPPLLVHRQSLVVIDGNHRLAAA